MIRVLTVGDLLPDGFDPKAIAHVRAEVEEHFAEGLALAGIEPEVAGDLLEVICNNLPKIGVVLECDVAGARAAGAMVYQEVALVPPIAMSQGSRFPVCAGCYPEPLPETVDGTDNLPCVFCCTPTTRLTIAYEVLAACCNRELGLVLALDACAEVLEELQAVAEHTENDPIPVDPGDVRDALDLARAVKARPVAPLAGDAVAVLDATRALDEHRRAWTIPDGGDAIRAPERSDLAERHAAAVSFWRKEGYPGSSMGPRR